LPVTNEVCSTPVPPSQRHVTFHQSRVVIFLNELRQLLKLLQLTLKSTKGLSDLAKAAPSDPAKQMDRQDTANIGNNSLHLMHSTQPNNTAQVLVLDQASPLLVLGFWHIFWSAISPLHVRHLAMYVASKSGYIISSL